jgi:hypothetical protein
LLIFLIGHNGRDLIVSEIIAHLGRIQNICKGSPHAPHSQHSAGFYLIAAELSAGRRRANFSNTLQRESRYLCSRIAQALHFINCVIQHEILAFYSPRF